MILLGSIYVNEWSRRLRPSRISCTPSRRQLRTAIRSQARSECTSHSLNEETGEMAVDYALITVKPNVSGEHAVMTLSGIFSEGTEGAAEFVTTRNHLTVLGQRLRQLREPNATSEASTRRLLKVQVENGTPTTISLLSLRALPETGKQSVASRPRSVVRWSLAFGLRPWPRSSCLRPLVFGLWSLARG